MNYDYTFLERWILPGPAAAAYAALADFELYSRWGNPTYLASSRQGKPGAVGTVGRVAVRGGLPYEIQLNFCITRVVPARELEMSVSGDLEGQSILSVRTLPGGTTELVSDFRCNPRRSLLRALTPLLRPLFCWNHQRAINPAMQGLARHLAARAQAGVARRRRGTEAPRTTVAP